MIIHIGKNEYRINNSFVSSSKNLLLRILRKVKEESNIRGVSEYYITFIIMMYVASSTTSSVTAFTERIPGLTGLGFRSAPT